MKAIAALVLLLAVTLADFASAAPQAVKLVAHNQRSSSGTRATLIWKSGPGCSAPYVAPCLNPTNPWNVANGVVGSNAIWTWDSATGVLQGTGLFWSTSFISSVPGGSPVISDEVTNLRIDTVNDVNSATSYHCVEGTFLATVGASGCENINFGIDFGDDSTSAWNVGGNPKCVNVVINGSNPVNGDDFSLYDGSQVPFVVGTPVPRGLTVVQAGAEGPGCVQTSGGFDLFTVVQESPTVIISNGVCLGTLPVDITCASANWMTFAFFPDAIDDGPIQTAPGIAVPISVMANDTGYTGEITLSVVTPPTQGTAVVTGSPGPQSGLMITYTANPGAAGPDNFTYRATDSDGVTSDTATVSLHIGVREADPFTFVDQVNVPVSTLITSTAVTISGIDSQSLVSVSGDPSSEYSINNGPFTSSAGTVSNNDAVRVRHISSSTPATAVNTTLNVGGVSDTFTSTTLKYAIDDTATTTMNHALQIDVLQNDAGLASTVYVSVWAHPAHGSAATSGSPGSPAGIRITYTPNAGFVGPDSFEYLVESGLVVDYATVTVTVVNDDRDGDGVLDISDNCTLVPNPTQIDADGDGYGNACDADLTNNGIVNFVDLSAFRAAFGTVNAEADLNASGGTVNFADLAIFRSLFGKPPGPSGLHP